MSFLVSGENVHTSFRTSRLYPSLFKYFFFGAVMFLLAILTLFNFVGLPPDPPEFPIRLVLAALAAFSGLAFLITGEIKREKMGTYYITNYRIIVTKGILGTKMDSVSYAMIVNVKVSQTLVEKIFGLGNLEVSTARGQQEIDMIGIPKPREIENIIYKFLESHTGSQDYSQSRYRG